MKKTVVFLITMFLVVACTSRYVSNGDNQYMQSTNGPNLVVPPPLNSTMISHFYDLPPQTRNPAVSILPPIAAG